MKKYLILTLALLLVLVCSTLVTAYAGTCGCGESYICDGLRTDPRECNLNDPDCQCSCCNQQDQDPVPSTSTQPTPTPVTYYPDYDEVEESAAPAPVEEASPKTGDTAVTAAAMLLGIGAAAVVVTCVRKSRA